jgi:hypothetical protein
MAECRLGSFSGTYQLTDSRRGTLDVWVNVFRFYYEHCLDVLVILPFLFVPVFTDALHTILVHQHMEVRKLRVGEALQKAAQVSVPLFRLKWAFWWRSSLWSLIPLVGWVKDAQLRVAWGMASNVMLLEGKTGLAGRQRAAELSQHPARGLLIRTLVTLPSLFFISISILYVWSEGVIQSDWLYRLWIMISLWIILPASATANTLAYLNVIKQPH